jgi:hypothetical protein
MAVGCTPTGSTGGPTSVTGVSALSAVTQVLAELRRFHPDATVVYMASVSVTPDGRDRHWIVHVAVPDQRLIRHYRVQNGRLADSGSSSGMTRESQPFLFSVASGAPPAMVDSTRAVEIADQAGASAYKQRTRVVLRNMLLYVSTDGVPVWFVGYSKPDTTLSATAEIDARTGQVLHYEEERVTKTRATPSAGRGTPQ